MRPTIYLGIDCGMTGALALVGPFGIRFVDPPLVQVEVGGKRRRSLDEARLVSLVEEALSGAAVQREVLATVEHVHANPKNGSIGNFSLGQSYGTWRGVLAALRIPYQAVPYQRWQKAILGGPKTDQQLVALAGQFYPEVSRSLYGPRGGLLLGRADALLLARYGATRGFEPAPEEKVLQAG